MKNLERKTRIIHVNECINIECGKEKKPYCLKSITVNFHAEERYHFLFEVIPDIKRDIPFSYHQTMLSADIGDGNLRGKVVGSLMGGEAYIVKIPKKGVFVGKMSIEGSFSSIGENPYKIEKEFEIDPKDFL